MDDETDDLVIRPCRPGCVLCELIAHNAFQQALDDLDP